MRIMKVRRNRGDGKAGLTVAEVARKTGLSVQRVRQLEAAALKKLRRHPLILALAREHGVA